MWFKRKIKQYFFKVRVIGRHYTYDASLKKLYVHITTRSTRETGSLVMRKKQTEMRLQMKDVVELHRR